MGVPVWNDEALADYFESTGITDEVQQANLGKELEAKNEPLRAVAEYLKAAGLTVVEIPMTVVPEGLDVKPALEYGFKDAINGFLSELGSAAPIASLEDIIAYNKGDLANRAPYGQGHLEASQNTKISADEYEKLKNDNQRIARERIDTLLNTYDIDIIVSSVSQLYAPAGYPALSVPSGYAEDGMPEGVVFVGGYLSEPQLLAVGYAYEQMSQARVVPDLNATMKLIEGMEKP